MYTHTFRAAFLFCLAFGLACTATKDIGLAEDGHMPLGKAKVWAFLDGEFHNIVPLLFQGISSEEQLKLLGVEKETDIVPTDLNVFFVELGEHRILVDAGCGSLNPEPNMGQMISALAAKGFAPESIDTVLLTHTHADHMGGIFMEPMASMKPRFPNATVWVHEAELAFWTDPGLLEFCPEPLKDECAQIQQGVQLLRALLGDTLKTFSSGQQVLPGIQAVHTPGHTPGHTAFLLASEGHKLLFVGDMILNIHLQTAFPKVSIAFDADAPTSIDSRLEWLEKAANEKLWLAGAHFPFPGIGRIEKHAPETYAFIPIE